MPQLTWQWLSKDHLYRNLYTEATLPDRLSMVTLQLQQLVVYPGQRIQLRNVNWHEFEAILDELGEKRSSRIAYSNGVLVIRMPSPNHEVDTQPLCTESA